MYLSEVAPANLRGGLNSMFQLATTLGIFSANMLVTPHKLSSLGAGGSLLVRLLFRLF